ncbi:hypothetical protein BFJ63_vAg16827 [Fusarium oxysporum f. sp. narcissi]|uniref:Uncharacterized protein n=1 Tax=Fusarium oxysporum f. sp. narcissi TaxID=451672 RepID=A0A4Q2V8K3_FUSOX|nr:hypothetical protein BFJ63_vAg16827 [Fusarium oxysporum f. sp. narcissi]
MDQLASPEELRKRCDLVDKIHWPWTDDLKLKRLRESNEHLIIARPELQDTYYKSDLYIFILDVSKCTLDMPIYNIFQAPDTHILVRRFDEDPENSHRPWKMEPFDEEDHGRRVDLGIQISDGMRLLIEHLDIYSQHLKESLGMLSISSWEELTKWLVIEHTAEPLEISSKRPFKRQTYHNSTKSVLLELGWHETWIEAQHRRRGQVNNHKDNAFPRSTAGPADKTDKPMQGPTPEVSHGPRYNNQDDDGQIDTVVMSERRRGKRRIGAINTLDEAESSSHAERRARQQREATQRTNDMFLADYKLAEMLADRTLP